MCGHHRHTRRWVTVVPQIRSDDDDDDIAKLSGTVSDKLSFRTNLAVTKQLLAVGSELGSNPMHFQSFFRVLSNTASKNYDL
jgi:hypothetical protein